VNENNTLSTLVQETGASREDILALVDQLVSIDGREKVVVREEGSEVEFTTEAAEVIVRQLKG
jgi:hypothetical protein